MTCDSLQASPPQQRSTPAAVEAAVWQGVASVTQWGAIGSLVPQPAISRGKTGSGAAVSFADTPVNGVTAPPWHTEVMGVVAQPAADGAAAVTAAAGAARGLEPRAAPKRRQSLDWSGVQGSVGLSWAGSRQQAWQRAADLSMLDLGPGWSGWTEAPPGQDLSSPAQLACMQTLLASAQVRVDAVTDFPKVNTALGWLVDFARETGRVPFLSPSSDERRAYNQTTLEAFAEFIRLAGSKQAWRVGATLKAASIAGNVSTVRLLAGKIARRAIVSEELNTVLPAMFKQMRKADGPAGARKLSRGVRSRHLRDLAAMGYDRSSRRGMMRWAAALAAHNMMLRGGEVGHPETGHFDPARGIVWDSIVWKEPCPDSAWLPWLTVSVVGIKDPTFTHQRCLMPIRRRGEHGVLGTDPLCTYDAIRIVWRSRMAEIASPQQRRDTPFFTGVSDVAAWSTADSRAVGKNMAATLGLDPSEFGGKCWRIGGACDFLEIMGEKGADIIKQRGRWHSDVALIYQRALASTLLDASVAIGAAHSMELEALCAGWIQPATYR
jgi:hypothetical protein